MNTSPLYLFLYFVLGLVYLTVGLIPTVRAVVGRGKPVVFRGKVVQPNDLRYGIAISKNVALAVTLPMIIAMYYYLHTHYNY